MPHSSNDHFEGKSVPDHIKEARIKGMLASSETHGTEISGHKAAFADSLRDASIAMALISEGAFFFLPSEKAFLFTLFFLLAWMIWKTCRSALLAWARLDRLHRLIEEERWEIQHHRPQEREELMELYQAKGFEGPLLTEVLNVLMADDNRLLEVMLTEELGLSLEAYEHPLKQAFGAFLGSATAVLLGTLAYFFFPSVPLAVVSLPLFLIAALCTAHIERILLLPSLLWNFAVFALSYGFIHFGKGLIR